jgi:small subunit ribosomal protein S16
VAVRIRMKKFGRRHRPFYRICAMDSHTARDGRVLEELGTYDPLIPEVDARAVLNGERIKHWLDVGATPSEKVGVLIKKYGLKGTRRAHQQVALDRLAQSRRRPEPLVVEHKEGPAAPDQPDDGPPTDDGPPEAADKPDSGEAQ